MNNCRELITLQFGNYSNHVGSHFWNIQELSFDYTGTKASDINHDVLYRAGGGSLQTYTPRLLLAELKGGLGSLPITGGLPQPSASHIDYENIDWTTVEKKEEPPIEKNDYLKYINNEAEEGTSTIETFDFETKVNTWTDFLFPRFNDRTIHMINEYKHNNDEVPFDVFHLGYNAWKSTFFEIFTDNIRKYSEECDNFQGFQITVDAVDGFGGLAHGCLQYLNDEYASKSIFVAPLIPSYFSDNDPTDQKQRDISIMKDSVRVLNLAFTFESLFDNCSLFVPMSCGESGWRKPGTKRQFQNLDYNSKIHYHSSAIIASALDTLSYSYRLKNGSTLLSDICADMTGYGRKMAAASLDMPFYMQQKLDLIDHLDKLNYPVTTSITPNCKISNEKIFQHLTVRGIPENRLKQPLKNADKQIKMAAYRCESVKEMFELYYQCNYHASVTNVFTSPYGLEIKSPFPNIFSKDLNKEGFVKEFIDDQINPESIPIIAGLHNGNFIFDTLESLCRETKRIKMGRMHKFTDLGLEYDDYTECLNKFSEMQTNYEENYEL